ncbi:efflux RND transporter periplasmic adaptor subunit [Ancylobacter sp. WKF20]|uniref:efflux RND transporter periplasmic adaptor subunit n=1 Tax=Ancylobacter sp. WKF20 TaxID=3039801 RepID=UPI0024343AC4|nr:efflux RND transporter periplasmic adaptor subunit [Ancylobacter sp. WKF20]WGD29179.1 efflux RND transporter periplasmic adaptor subunit [Ancylobacter sp. WKF20]
MTLTRWMQGAALIGALAVLAGCDSPPPAQETAVRPVKSMVVKTEAFTGAGYAGTVQPRVETDLAFRTLGRIIARDVDTGDLVTKGQLIGELDPLALKMAVTSAEADLRNAQATLENATVNEQRKKTLAATNAGSAADFDLAEQELKTAQANQAQTQASLDKAREQLGYAKLLAEFDGIVTATSAEVGQVVTAGQAVVRVARLADRDVVIDVSEARHGALKLGQPWTIALQLDPSVKAHGVLREIAPQADSNTRSYRVKIALDTPPDAFRFGSVVTAWPDEAASAGISVPARAVLTQDGATYVWVVDRTSQSVERRPVQLQPEAATGNFRVLTGLTDGDEVVLAGVHQLADGQKIRLSQETTR